MWIHIRFFLIFLLVLFCIHGFVYFFLFKVQSHGKSLIFWWQKELRVKPSLFKQTILGFDQGKTYDLIFAGSSHTYRIFDPLVFSGYGFSSYNLGSSSQTMELSDAIIRRFTDQGEYFVLEFYPPLFTISGEEGFWDWNASVEDYSLLARGLWNLQSLRCLNLFTIKPFIDSFNRNLEENLPSLSFRNGFASTRDSAGFLHTYQNYTIDIDSAMKRLRIFESSIHYLQSLNKKFCFVYSPVPKKMAIGNEKFLVEEFEKLCRRNQVPFFNFSRSLPLKDEYHFFDDDHLNQAGVEIFNACLIQEWERSGFLVPRRDIPLPGPCEKISQGRQVPN